MAVSDIIQGPCKIYYGTYGLALPADSVAVGGSWPAGWNALGYTKVPLSVDFAREMTDHDIQESLAAVARRANKEELTIETTLAEFVASELVLDTGGTYSVTPASSGVTGIHTIVAGDDTTPTVYSWGFEGSYVSAAGNLHPIRLHVYRATAEFGVKLEFGKAETTGVPLRVKAISDMTKTAGERLFKLVKVTAPAT